MRKGPGVYYNLKMAESDYSREQFDDIYAQPVFTMENGHFDLDYEIVKKSLYGI